MLEYGVYELRWFTMSLSIIKFQVGMDPFCLTAAIGHIDGMRRFLEAGKNPDDTSMAVITKIQSVGPEFLR